MLSSVLIYLHGGEFATVRKNPRRPLERRPPYRSVARPIGPGRYAACARMGSWNIETPSSGPRKPKHGWKPLVGSPRKRGRDSARTPQRKPSPASLSNCACNRLKKPTITRTDAYCCWGIPTLQDWDYRLFDEVRVYGILRTSPLRSSTK